MIDTRRSLTRRDLFRMLVAAGPASLAAACGWTGGPALESKLRAVSRVNDWVGEKLLFSTTRLVPDSPITSRTPDRHFPGYSITYNRNRAYPVIERPDTWALHVDGLVRKPIQLTLTQLEALPRMTYTVKHHCVEGWTAVATWTGVPVAVVAAMAEPMAAARYLRFNSFDSGYYNGWDLASAMHPQTILAYAFNDRPLTAKHGAPLRLYAPVKLGYKLTKYLTSMTFTADRPGGYWEDQGYPWFAGV